MNFIQRRVEQINHPFDIFIHGRSFLIFAADFNASKNHPVFQRFCRPSSFAQPMKNYAIGLALVPKNQKSIRNQQSHQPSNQLNWRMSGKFNHKISINFTGTALVMTLTVPVFAQDKPFTQAGTAQVPSLPPTPPKIPEPATAGTNAPAAESAGPLEKFFNGQIPEALAKGKFNLNVRLRYEQVNEENQPPYEKNSYAPTLRTRFGFTSAPLYGFQGMLEGVNISAIGPEHNYNAGGSNGQGARPPVNDPPMTRLDQAWLGYSNTNFVPVMVKGGQQPINLDNQRFVGDSGWRQNMQTFDAIGLQSSPVAGLSLYYSYLWNVNRVSGNVSGLPPANTDFDSQSHLINVSYSGWEYGRFVGYAYLLDLSNAAGNANSCATYGGYFAGATPISEQIVIDYRAEFAWQNEYANSPLQYNADYYSVEAGANIRPVAFGAGYEVLGSGANNGVGGGRVGFKTPLASPHSFNGWAEAFVTHPANGLQDLYGFIQVTLPAQIPVKFVYHKFDADHGDGNYGQEFDVAISKKLGKNWSALIEYADYLGEDAAIPALTGSNVNIQKFWAAVEFNF